MLLFFHNGRISKKAVQTRCLHCFGLGDPGLFFQSGRLLGLIMQAIATVIGADLGGFADEFGACFEESLFTFFHDVPPVFDWVNGLLGNP